MHKAPKYVAIAFALAGFAVHAQTNSPVNFLGGAQQGFHIYGFEVSSTYTSSAYPLGTTTTITPTAPQIGSNMTFGAMASGGWHYERENVNLSAFYSGGYNQSERYDLSGFNHLFRLSANWNITPKWTFSLSGSGQYQTLAQYLFEPTSASVIAQTPTSFDNLAASQSVGQSTGAANLTGAALGSAATPSLSPATGLLVGTRVFAYSSQLEMNYAATTRLSFHIAGATAAGETTFGKQTARPTYITPHSIGVDAGGSMSYELSPRTTFGVQLTEGRNANRYQDAYTTQASASLGRKMGTNWFLRASGGGAYTRTTQQSYGSPIVRQFIGTANLGYQLATQVFLVSYARTSMDQSAFAAVGTNSLLSATWSWRPSTNWSVFASLGQQKLDNTGYESFSGWTASGGSMVHLVGNLVLTAQYVYSNVQGSFAGTRTKLSIDSARISIGWTPAWQQSVRYSTVGANQH